MSVSVETRIQVRPATSIADYIFLRRLRNEVAAQMTNNPEPISWFRQLKFYLSRPAGVDVYVGWLEDTRAAYLLLRHTADAVLITEAVSSGFRRRGIAAELIAYAQSRHGNLRAEILEGNEASIRLHERCGFRRAGSDGRVATYEYRAADRGTPASSGAAEHPGRR